MLDPKTISVTVTNDKERDFACRWFERNGYVKHGWNGDGYPHCIAPRPVNHYGKTYTNYSYHLSSYTGLDFSEFIAQVEPQAGDWVECVKPHSFGSISVGAKYKIARIDSSSWYHIKDDSGVIVGYGSSLFSLCLPPEEKETTGEIKEIIGYKSKATGKCFKYLRKSQTLGMLEILEEGLTADNLAKMPEFILEHHFEKIYAPTKPKPITLFLGEPKTKFQITEGKVEVMDCSGKIERWEWAEEDWEYFFNKMGRSNAISVNINGRKFNHSDHEQLTKAIKDTK